MPGTLLERNGVVGVLEPHIVELDNDYNLLHDSNPEGSYGIFGLLAKYGRDQYKQLWSAVGNQAATTFGGNGEPSAIAGLASDLTWAPTCPTAKVISAGPSVARGALVALNGTGFADCPAHVGCGNVVHIRTHTSEVVLISGSPWIFSETASKIELQVPSETAIGKGYVWVETAGVMSNLLPVTVGH